MTDDLLDRRLKARLEGLARAVPVANEVHVSTAISPVVGSAFGARQRMSVAGLSIAAVALLVVGAGLVTRGFGLGAGVPGDSPVVGVAREADFELTIRAPKAIYSSDRPIDGITATLRYLGPDASITAFGSGSGLIGFGVRETDGPHEMGPGYHSDCQTYELQRDSPLTVPFAKSGGFYPEQSDYPWNSAYFFERALRLEAGQWFVSAGADFFTGDGCGGTRHYLKAEIRLGVDP